MREAGPDFLNTAFHAFGSLEPGNHITRVTNCEICPGGSTGQKVFLSVEYEHPSPQLHGGLFVKFSRDFADPVRDNRGKYEMESESRFAALSCLPGFPITVPKTYFTDFHHDSHTGLIITQQIPFGAGGIETQHRKCLDHEIPDPLPYYRVIITSLARIAAGHRSGRLSGIAGQFPFDAAKAAARRSHPVQCAADSRTHRAIRGIRAQPSATSAREYPHPELYRQTRCPGAGISGPRSRVKRFLQSNPDLIALCHWNANIDNAWFWRDSAGVLQCGLMDWGHVGQMNLAFALWGCLSAACHGIWENHFDMLLNLFIDELAQHGGRFCNTANSSCI